MAQVAVYVLLAAGDTTKIRQLVQKYPEVPFDLWLIHIAGSGLGSLYRPGYLYYAEISHWFGSRLRFGGFSLCLRVLNKAPQIHVHLF